MTKIHRSTGNSIPAYFFGRPRSVYRERFGKLAPVASLDYTAVATVEPVTRAA